MKLSDLTYSVFDDGNHAILDFSKGKKMGYKTVVDRCVHTTSFHTNATNFIRFIEEISKYSKVEINHGVLDTLTTDDYFPIRHMAPSKKSKWKFIESNGERYAGDMKVLEKDFKIYVELKEEYLNQKLQRFKNDKSLDVEKLKDEILKISYEAEECSRNWGYLFALEKDIILDRMIKKSGIEEFAKRFRFTYGREMEEEKKRFGTSSFTPIHIEVDHRIADCVFVDRVVRDNGIKYDIEKYPEIEKNIEIAKRHHVVNEVIRHYVEFHKQIERGLIEPKVVIIDLNDRYFLDDKSLSWLMR